MNHVPINAETLNEVHRDIYAILAKHFGDRYYLGQTPDDGLTVQIDSIGKLTVKMTLTAVEKNGAQFR